MTLVADKPSCEDSSHSHRLRVSICGAVQGVGFRPFVHRLATSLDLVGYVQNTTSGVHIEVEGPDAHLETFLSQLERDKPANAFIQSIEPTFLDTCGYRDFQIMDSLEDGERRALVLPDIATCGACRNEIFDPDDRRYMYPFTNCTHCGPRYTLLHRVPYDRRHTSMAGFTQCPDCQQEYDDPADRRFHAQPNACPTCGPHLTWCDNQGAPLACLHHAMLHTVDALQAGSIVAVKGLGGFHLVTDARSPAAVAELRARKNRDEKPFAVMFRDLESVRQACDIDALEARLLASPAAPIVLVRKRDAPGLAPNIAPGNPTLGAMLPATPLHHILLHLLDFPIVATSGNLVDEPLCIDNEEAVARLQGIADFYLLHDRPIVRPVDDSVVRVVAGREMILRRARGYAPLPITLTSPVPPTLAVGAHMKSAVALSRDNHLFLSQHLGDLDTVQAHENFTQATHDLEQLLDVQPERLAKDMHPDYASTTYAATRAEPATAVQHHFAHIVSCMVDNEIDGPVLGVAWDGTGDGGDGTVWGGEFMLADTSTFQRVASLRPFPLPGGDLAAREPRRSALGLLFAAYGLQLFEQTELLTAMQIPAPDLRVIGQSLVRSVNAPRTSSVGRLFDAVASLTDLCQVSSFEGQAAMALEFSAADAPRTDAYPLPVIDGGSLGWQLDWQPLLKQLLDDLDQKKTVAGMARRFHNALAHAIVQVALRVDRERVVLSGGCFQNRILTEQTILQLRKHGFTPYWHQRIPPNDGGIAAGQLVAAAQAPGGA